MPLHLYIFHSGLHAPSLCLSLSLSLSRPLSLSLSLWRGSFLVTVCDARATCLQRYGGVDAILLWSTFPQLGIDDRNQYDMVRTMPGGVAGVKALIAELHSHGVKVLLAYNPWDTGTRQER